MALDTATKDHAVETIVLHRPVPARSDRQIAVKGDTLAEKIVNLCWSGRPFTDVRIEEQQPIHVNLPSGWKAVGTEPVELGELLPLFARLDQDWEKKLVHGAIDKALDLTQHRLRCSAFLADGGRRHVLSIRRLPLRPPSIKDTGLPVYVKDMAERGKGLVIVSGATGCGKTTTLAALLEHINQTRDAHIVTIEKPIEYRLERARSIISQKEVGSDVDGFARGLHDALRQKPDVIMLGEVRDRDTADTLLHAAESGHLVLATLHATSAQGALAKLLSFFPAEEGEPRRFTLAGTLVGVICQALLPGAREDGWVLAAEIMMNTPQIAKAIEEPGRLKQIREIVRRGEDKMSRTLNDELLRLVKGGVVRKDKALKASNDEAELNAGIMLGRLAVSG
jgi:twitching motility protein PilT